MSSVAFNILGAAHLVLAEPVCLAMASVTRSTSRAPLVAFGDRAAQGLLDHVDPGLEFLAAVFRGQQPRLHLRDLFQREVEAFLCLHGFLGAQVTSSDSAFSRSHRPDRPAGLLAPDPAPIESIT